MRALSARWHRGLDSATAWTLAGCTAATLLLVRLAVIDYRDSDRLFHPHGYCYLWLPSLVSTHVISDLLIGLSYVAISTTLVFLVWKARKELPFSWMFVAFGAFIVCCGATHFMEIWTLWTPVFWLSAGVKIVTAVASVVTAIALPPLVPKILRLSAEARLSEERRLQLEQAHEELERRVAERTHDLEQTLEDLRRSNADLEQFAYVASHDLREPLRNVANYTELLAQRYRDQLDEKANKYIHYATDGARRMQQLVDDLLAYSRVGSQGGHLRPVDASKVLHAAVESLGEAIRESGATIDVSGTLPVVLADDSQLFQLFQNLVANAIKFRSDSSPKISVHAAFRNGRWVFALQDNGIGIDMRYADRIFQMFQRLHDKTRYEGSGIGLAIAKRIVERHGGQIWFESSRGTGTTFFFTMPSTKTA
jgi:signal transduction histidine kinase